MTGPDVQRLRIIADRTEKGLSPDEAKVLRDGLDQVADRLRKDAATIAGQQARIRELKQKAVDATRDLGATAPYRVKCPTCGAPPTERCRATRGYVPPRQPHSARLDTAARTP